MPTQMLLCEHAEKLEAAKALYELHLEWVDSVLIRCNNLLFISNNITVSSFMKNSL